MPASAPGETTMTPALIGLDWGTSALRAYLLAADGTVVDGRTAPLGILKVADADFEAVFEDVAGPWLGAHGALPVVASGMIGSRQGWVEAPYVACPAGAEDLARGLVTHLTGNGRSVRFVPGLSIADRDGVPDFMRARKPRSSATWPAAAAMPTACTCCPAPTASGRRSKAAGSPGSPRSSPASCSPCCATTAFWGV